MKPKVSGWDARLLTAHFKLPLVESKHAMISQIQRRLAKKGYLVKQDDGTYRVTNAGTAQLNLGETR